MHNRQQYCFFFYSLAFKKKKRKVRIIWDLDDRSPMSQQALTFKSTSTLHNTGTNGLSKLTAMVMSQTNNQPFFYVAL
jgi:hypothetical protein